jgi:hypothetical protein
MLTSHSKVSSSAVSGLRVSGSRALGPSAVALTGDHVVITAGDQISLLKFSDWAVQR